MKRLLCILFLPSLSLAADIFVTPAGSGARDGSSLANAAPGTSASRLFDGMAAGDCLLLATGEYRDLSLTLSTGGSPGNPKVIEGAPGAVLSSGWSVEKPDKGSTAITLSPGLSHVVVRNLSIRSHCFGVRALASKEAPRAHLSFEGIAVDHVRHAFYLSDCDDVSVLDSTAKRYSKHGFRFERGCDRVTLKNCLADCSEGDPVWETKTEVFPFGFIVNDGGEPNTSFLFQDCVAKNNIKSNQTVKYTNGDGFVAEGNNSGLHFVRCRAFRNQDGGFDIKVDKTRFTDCIAMGHRRDFRVWRNATLENCFAGGSQTGLWVKGGAVAVEGCTFLAHKKSAVEIDDDSSPAVALTRCLVVSGETDHTLSIGKLARKDSCIVAKTAAEAGLASPDLAWDGAGASMDSAKFPDKGFSSARISR